MGQRTARAHEQRHRRHHRNMRWAAVLVLLAVVGLAVMQLTPSPAPAISSGSPVKAPRPAVRGGLSQRTTAMMPARPEPAPMSAYLSGVVEGFYGPRWSAGTTVHMIKFLARQGMNTFVYAPKNDPYQRADWATPYPKSQLGYLERVVAAAEAAHVRFVYSVSPGLSITYSSAADRAALLAKINQIRALGVNWFMLSFDDIAPTLNAADAAAYHDNLALAQTSLANWVWAAESRTDQNFGLLFTPTDYDGLQDNPYWETLKQDLTPNALVLWTGPDVLSTTITATEARQVEEEVGHRVVIWDNYPVNDYTYVEQHAPRLMLGPLTGRSPNLPGAVAGYLFNPMLQARASEVALATGADYLKHPHHYKPAASWQAALAKVGGAAEPAFQLLAEASDTSFLPGSPTGTASGDAALNAAIAAAERGGPNVSLPILDRLSQQFTAMGQVNSSLRTALPDPRLYSEVAPWSVQLSLEGTVGLAAVWVLTNLHEGLSTTSAVAQLVRLNQEMAQSHYALNTTAEVSQLVAWTLAAARAG